MPSSIETRGPELLAVNSLFLATAVIANGLRCFVRVRMVKAFGMDDWLMTIATLSFICYASFSIAGVHYGTGRHYDDLTHDNVKRATNRWWYCFLFYSTTMIISKVSIGWSLLRIAVRRLHIWLIYGAIAISIAAGAAFFFVTLLQCWPVSYFWNKDQNGHCVNIEVIIALSYLYSVLNIISDFTFAILPGFIVWNLQLGRNTKLALIPLLTMGCVASCAVIARMRYLPRFHSPDFLWATVDIAIWSTVEQGLAVTAGSLATLRPLCRVVKHGLGLSSSHSHHTRPSTSQAFRSPNKASDVNDIYVGLNVAELGDVKSGSKEESNIVHIGPTNWSSVDSLSNDERRRAVRENSSGRSLHGKESHETLSGQEEIRIVVSRSFIVSHEPY